jgi:hypothetical protein
MNMYHIVQRPVFFVTLNYNNFLQLKNWDWIVNESADIAEKHQVEM